MFKRSTNSVPTLVCLPVYPFRERVKGVVWGISTGLLTAIAMGWMTEAPWLTERLSQLWSWLPNWSVLLP